MNAKETILWLENIPPLTEIYVQTSATALEKVKVVWYDKLMGCAEFLTKIEERNEIH